LKAAVIKQGNTCELILTPEDLIK